MKSANGSPSTSTDVLYRSAGEYEGRFKEIAKKVKMADMWAHFDAIQEAAQLLSKIIPRRYVLVPIPSHIGFATYNLDICNLLKKQYGYRVSNCLRCKPHDSLCSLKNLEKESGKEKGSLLPSPEEMGFFKVYEPQEGRVCLVDNVIASGTTAVAAASLFPGSMIFCIASDETFPKIPGIHKYQIPEK